MGPASAVLPAAVAADTLLLRWVALLPKHQMRAALQAGFWRC